MKKIVKTFAECADASLRRKCERIPPEYRRMIVIGLLAVFAASAVYMAVRPVFFPGNRRQLPEPKHIRQLDLPGQGAGCIDTLKPGSHGDSDSK